MKRFHSFLVAIIIASAASIMAQEPANSGFCGTKYNGADGKNLTWSYDPATTTITISGKGKMGDLWGGAPWVHLSASLTSVVISEGVTSIGAFAFFDTPNLSSVTFANSVTAIERNAFNKCPKLASVTLPESIELVDGYAFHDTPFYNSLPDGDVYFGKTYYCYKGDKAALASVSIKEGTKYIAKVAFEDCASLNSVSLPSTLIKVGPWAFSGCSELASVEIPDGVTHIDSYAFMNCSKLASINIPESVVYVFDGAFLNTPFFETIPDGDVYFGKTYYCYKGDINNCKSITFKEGTKAIAGYAINDNENIKTLTIPASVEFINEYALYNCQMMTHVYMEGNVPPVIDGTAFPRGLSILVSDEAYDAYKNNSDWKDLNIYKVSEGILRSGNCGSTADGSDGSNLKWTLSLDSTMTISGSGDMENFFYYNPWEDLNNLIDTIIISEGVRSIGNNAFKLNHNITSITIPEGVVCIGSNALLGCDKLTSVTLPESLTIVKGGAFDQTPFFNSLPDGDVYFGKTYYQNKGDILDSVVIKDGTTHIASYAFNDSYNLYSVTIPATVTTIYDLAFYECHVLNEVNVMFDAPIQIPNNTFYDVPVDVTVNVPCGAADKFKAAEVWNSFTNYNEVSPMVSVDVSNPAFGTANVVKQTACGDNEAQIEAVAGEGYEFVQWNDGSTENPRTVIVTKNVTYTAEFDVKGSSTSAQATAADNVTIYSNGTTLFIEGSEGLYRVFDAAGQLIYEGADTSITLSKGVYLIKANDNIKKVVL